MSTSEIPNSNIGKSKYSKTLLSGTKDTDATKKTEKLKNKNEYPKLLNTKFLFKVAKNKQ